MTAGHVAVSMRRLAFALDPINVTAEAVERHLHEVGFYQRQREGLGVFIDREDIERQPRATELKDFLHAIPGRTVRAPGLIRLRDMPSMYNPCDTHPPIVYVDGIRIEPTEWGTGYGTVQPNSWNRMIPLVLVEAIEVYRTPAEMPAQYNTGGEAGCGVILLWTRRGGY